jgi:hypothetical protein
VKTLENKPFALVGVNSDPDRKAVQEVLRKEQITWRSFWDKGQNGPIAKAWHVNAWPTFYIIDDKGVLRAQANTKEEMALAVTLLLRKVKKKATGDDADRVAKGAGESESEPRFPRKAKAGAQAADKDKAERQADTKLGFAKSLAEAGKLDKARQRLKEVMDRYPGTLAADQAKELFEKLAKE